MIAERAQRFSNLFEVENGQVSPLKAGSSSNQSFTKYNIMAKLSLNNISTVTLP